MPHYSTERGATDVWLMNVEDIYTRRDLEKLLNGQKLRLGLLEIFDLS